MAIPSRWIVPEILENGILINTAELRLYYFNEDDRTVMTFPIGIGDPRWPTPEGDFIITQRIINPTWTVPLSLRDKYPKWTVPAGPDNPLGKYWLGLDNSSYGIHGTNFPWSIGRLATQGCIRMYPEDIRVLFELVQKGSLIKIIHEPVKISDHAGKVFVEIHRDAYGKVGDLPSYAFCRLYEKKVANRVDFKKFRQAIQRQDGVPVDITRANHSTLNAESSQPDWLAILRHDLNNKQTLKNN
jgi:L,D-transpeptidase ErfK/SrfK